MYGDMKPGSTPIMPLIPNTMPAWLGAISTIDARGPDDTAPWNIVAIVRNTIAAVELFPKYAKATTIMPLTIQPMVRKYIT